VAIAGGNEIRVKTGIVEIDTTGGPGFGFEHFKQYDFLREKEFGFEHLKQYDRQGNCSDFRGRALAGAQNRQNDCRERRVFPWA
jgi:hypothetical protein